MSSDVVIRAADLGKKYVIGHEGEADPTLRDTIVRTASRAARSLTNLARGRAIIGGDAFEEFWALKDVSFEVRRGEVLGVIGRNGAGKSTLLKVLSRITEPTEGRVEIDGRISSLLEVGTGFHPELTGRENIFLNGAILGMARTEIRARFDEIVAFADVDRFLDTPVKRYSSGMYVRLAFAVAAHLEPEILIVDEVLAVGDVEFQRKCLGKMKDVAGGGRTVLLVSHNMRAIASLCDRTILLEAGKIVANGETSSVLELHARLMAGDDENPTSLQFDTGDFRSFEKEMIRPLSLQIGRPGQAPLRADEEITITFRYEQMRPLEEMRVVVMLVSSEGDILFASTDQSIRGEKTNVPGVHQTIMTIPANLLNERSYFVRLQAGIPYRQFLIEPTDFGPIPVAGPVAGGSTVAVERWAGQICPKLDWRIETVSG